MAYRRGGYVYQTQNPLAYLLGGLGQGISGGIERQLYKSEREEEERKNLIGQLLQGVAEGKIPAQMFATPEMQDLLQYAGVSGKAPIQKLMGQAEERAEARPKKQMVSPTGAAYQLPQAPLMSLEEVARGQEEKAKAAEMRRFYGVELPQHIAKQQAEKELAKAYEKTPSQKVQEAIEFFKVAESSGMPVENMTFNGIDYQTAIEKQKLYLTQAEKQQAAIGDYNKALTTAVDYRADAVKFLSGLKMSKSATLSPELAEQMRKYRIGLTLDRLEQLPAEKRIPLLAKEFNKVIQARNKDLRQQGIKAKMAGADIEQIEEIDSAIFDVKKDPDPIKDPPLGTGGGAKAEPSEEEINALVKRLDEHQRTQFQMNPSRGIRLLTIDELRKQARSALKNEK